MLPLVRQIVADWMERQQRLSRLYPEKDRLDRQRRTLDWPNRSRRYHLQEEIANAEQERDQALAEMDRLGLAVIDVDLGQVGFPTMVNNRRAFFSWRPGEETIQFWHFADDLDRRPIPSVWTSNAAEFRARGK
jgi:hypothetical protein